MKKLLETITCVDNTGKKYTIEHYGDFKRYTYLGDPPEEHLTLESYTWNSRGVVLTGDHTFYIPDIDTEVRKVA